MKRRMQIVVIALCLSSTSVGLLALTWRIWGYGILPGYLSVCAYTQDATPDGPPSQNPITIQVSCDDEILGDSGTEIEITSGEHILSFSSYSTEYETPHKEHVIVKPYEATHVDVAYMGLYGYLVVNTELHDAYYENSSGLDAGIFVDGEHKGDGYVCLRLDYSELGNHVVSFSELDGYTRPSEENALITKAATMQVTGTYERILTPEEEVYVYCRSMVRRFSPAIASLWINKTSTIVSDSFLQDIRDDRVKEVKYCVFKPHLEIWGSLDVEWKIQIPVKFIVARYAGVFEEDRIAAAEDLYYKLNSCGIDLRTTGGMHLMHYKDESECIVVANLKFEVGYEEVEDNFYRFKEEDIDALPDLSTAIELYGTGFAIARVRQVYVETDRGAMPFDEEWVPPFQEFNNLEENEKGWFYWTRWGYGYINPCEYFKSLLMEGL